MVLDGSCIVFYPLLSTNDYIAHPQDNQQYTTQATIPSRVCVDIQNFGFTSAAGLWLIKACKGRYNIVMNPIERKTGKVSEVLESGPDIQELLVETGGKRVKAVNYPPLTGEASPGDEVLLNVTAVSLGLGSGGRHFVMANLTWPEITLPRADGAASAGRGHIMKLRYTPLQFSVLTAEEEGSPWRESIEAFDSLGGMPVVVCELHSMLAPVCAALKKLSAGAVKIAYIMTDAACLPAAFSRTVKALRERQMISSVITCGNAFGGDIETVNKYTALAASHSAAGADIAVVAMGVGIVGTGTKLGTTALECGEWINAVHALGGRPAAVPRIGFGDHRPRHRGISHHTITSLTVAALAPAIVAFPELRPPESELIEKQIVDSGIRIRHEVRFEDGSVAPDGLNEYDMRVTTMGRGVEEEPAFFLACGAAARAAYSLLED